MGDVAINIIGINPVVARHIEVEFGLQGARTLEFLESAGTLLNNPIVFPKKGEVIDYSIREALMSLIDTQSKVFRGKQSNGTPWFERSWGVVNAHQEWADSRQSSNEVQQATLANLSAAIGEMAEFYEQNDTNTDKLIAVLLDRTGSDPSKEGMELIKEYRTLLREANNSLHGATLLDDATERLRRTIGLLETLFMPREIRNEQLKTLAKLVKPTEEDLAVLTRTVVVPGYLAHFLSLLVDPAWLDLLKDSKLLDLPKVQTWWVGHSFVRALKDTYPKEVLMTLEHLFSKSDKNFEGVYSIAIATHDLGLIARQLLLECLNLFPSQVADVAIDEIQNGSPNDDFVCDIGAIILNPSVPSATYYPEPLFDALEMGVDAENCQDRIRMLVSVIKNIPESDYPWSGLIFARGISVSDGRNLHGYQDGMQIVHTLTRVLKIAIPFISPHHLLTLTATLPDKVKDRIVPWALAQIVSATAEDLITEIQNGITSRSASVDDISLVDKLLSTVNQNEYVPRLRDIYGLPPTIAEVTATIETENFPKQYLYQFSWSPLFPPEVLTPWRQVLDVMEIRFGVPSKESILSKQGVEVGPVMSPISIETLASKSKQELLRAAIEWRPGVSDWTSSLYSLAEAIMQVMKGDLSVWTEDPVAIATELVHPIYISQYIQMLAEQLDNFTWEPKTLIKLVDLVLDEPWAVENIEGSERFDYKDPWKIARSAAIQLIVKMAGKDADLSEGLDDFIAKLIKRGTIPESEYLPSNSDPYERALSHDSGLALQALIAVAANDFRTKGSVRPTIIENFTKMLDLSGPIEVEIRSLIAAQLLLFNAIAHDWLEDKFGAIFTNGGDNGLSQAVIDVAVKWGGTYERLLHERKTQVWDAVKREVPNSLSRILIAMLRKLDGYSVAQVIDQLKKLNKLSTAGETLGRLVSNSPDLDAEMLAIAVDFWEKALASGTNESLTGFGWFAGAKQLSDVELAELWKGTLSTMNSPLDNSYSVSKRLGEMVPSKTVLAILDLMVRSQSDSLGVRMINTVALQVIESSSELGQTVEYIRLKNALQERNLL